MRQWNINPKLMCNQHILGEHCEMHMFVGIIKKHNISLKGYIDKGLVEIENISKRHDILVKEMKKRKMNHQSKIENTEELFGGKVNVMQNLIILRERCKKCAELQNERN